MEFTKIVEQNADSIYNYALKLTCHPEKAEDLAQETFIQAWKKLDQLKEEEALSKWLRTICYHLFLMDIRKKDEDLILKDQMEELEQEGKVYASWFSMPEEEVLVEEAIKDLQNGCFYAMVRRLSLPQRIAFSLVDMFGMTNQEAAEVLEVSEGALKGLLYRARMNLDSFFADHCNLIQTENPCSCKAWINFRENHNTNKQKMREQIQTIDYMEKGYLFDGKVRGKIAYLYRNMPERKPSEKWYQNVINTISAS